MIEGMMLISFGGSHRKNRACRLLLGELLGEAYSRYDYPLSLGSKRRILQIPDTAANRQWIKEQKDFSLARSIV